MATASTGNSGVSPAFTVSAEEFLLNYFTTVTPISIDGVSPPTLGVNGGASIAMDLVNRWNPWIDEKIVEPKWDGACAFLGMMSNRPTFIKDYHFISIMRAVDYVLQPKYAGVIRALIDSPTPIGPPTS